MSSLAALRGQIAQWVRTQRCALLGGDVGEGEIVSLSGLAGRQALGGLRQGIATFAPPNQIDWRVNAVDAVFCPALNALHPIVPSFGATGVSRLGLEMVDGKTRLHDGERVRVRLTMPDFAGSLRVDYVAHDNTVQHLYPQRADPKNRIVADVPRIRAAGEIVDLADPAWVIGQPYGTDMIIAVASSRPLFDQPRSGNAETADAYLRELQGAIENARQRGDRLAGAAITCEALP
jgi:hypothetical protein